MSPSPTVPKLALLLPLLLAWLGTSPAAQDGTVDREALAAAIEALAGSEDAADVERRETLEATLATLGQADAARDAAARFSERVAQAPALRDALEAELAQEVEAPAPLAPDLPTRDLEQRLRDAESTLEDARGEVEELASVQAKRQERQSTLPEDLARARRVVTEVEESLATLPADTDGALRDARRAELERARAELALLEAERAHVDAYREIGPLQRERARRRTIAAEERVETLQDLVTAARKRDAEEAAAEAARQRRESMRSFPALASLAAANEKVARDTTNLPARTDEVLTAREEIEEDLAELRRRFDATRRRVSIGGLSEGMGEVLRRDYEWLADLAALRARSAERERELSETLIKELEYQEAVSLLDPVPTEHERLMAGLGLAEPDEAIEDLARKLLENQRTVLDAAIEGHDTLAEALYQWQAKQDELVEESTRYRDYIAERILWVRSTSPNCLPSLVALPRHALEVVADLGLQDPAAQFASGLHRRAGRTIVWALLAGVLLLARRGVLQRRTEIAELVRFHRTDRFLWTLVVTLQCVLLALPVPLVLYALGDVWHEGTTNFVRAFGTALRHLAPIAFVLGFTRRVAQEKSLGDAHFRWSARSMAQLRRELHWFTPTFLLVALVSGTMRHVARQDWNDSIGRVAFVVAMLVMSVLAYRLQRQGGALGPVKTRTKKTLFGRTHRLWSMLAVLTPLALVALTVSGYTYTAEQFELRVRETLLLAGVLVLVRALLFRWLFLVRRRLAVEQARAKARARMEAAAADEDSPATPLDEDAVDIPALDQQTQRLFKNAIAVAAVLGLFFLWADVLPALRGLERVQLYPTFQVLADAEESVRPPSRATEVPAAAEAAEPLDLARGPMGALADASQSTGSTEDGATTVVTLGDLLLALLILLLTGTAAKNLPGLLEISLLQRLPLDGGSRYAISTLLRYVIVIVGVTAAAGTVGLGWNKVQWLAAALTFGLAFGLQEIFANFVSGLIILIERPVRVGDFVTVGETDGRITRVRMRATTVQDFDRRELLIPNREFITSTVINWTLSDPITRLVIPVGVAYGSNTELVHEKLLEAARAEPLVIEDPEPHVVFRAFGSSSLDFELRAFIANRDVWYVVTDRLHSRVDALFREAGIEISFPQRDLHVRSAPALEPLLGRPRDP